MADDDIRHYATSAESVDAFIDNSYDPSGLLELTRNFSLDKAASLLQYGLYPNYELNVTHPLAKAILKANRFPNTDMEAAYLYFEEVKEIWQQLKRLDAQTIVDNLRMHPKYQEEDVLMGATNYALYNFSHLLSAFYSALSYKEGLVFHYQ